MKDNEVLKILGRKRNLFINDYDNNLSKIKRIVENSKILIIGAAGSIGFSTVHLISKLKPVKLTLIDINENELAETVRKLRIENSISKNTNFSTHCIDILSYEFNCFSQSNEKFDFILNFSALKHVRSERDPYTLMRLLRTNIIGTMNILKLFSIKGKFHYFCLSTDKATNPVNLMGASKLLMEIYSFQNLYSISVSSARFANVAFSNGSLLQSFERRFKEFRPIVTPIGIKRYFVTLKEAGIICLLSCFLGKHNETFIPSKKTGLELTDLAGVAKRYIKFRGYIPKIVSEKENETKFKHKNWPLILSETDTTGEKPYEEFSLKSDILINRSFKDISIIKNENKIGLIKDFDSFNKELSKIFKSKIWSKDDLVDLIFSTGIPLNYVDFRKSLDDKL